MPKTVNFLKNFLKLIIIIINNYFFYFSSIYRIKRKRDISQYYFNIKIDSMFKASHADHPYFPFGGSANLDLSKEMKVVSY